MDENKKTKHRRVRDPKQRTITGGLVHFLWRVICFVLVIAVTFGIIGGVAAQRLYTRGVQYIEEDIKPNAHYTLEGVRLNQSSFIYAKNPETGKYEELRQLLALENRIWVTYDEIPADLINATVAIEDKRFWVHDGVDWQRTLAASANMFLGGSTYGGSTLTQQLIKNLTQEKDVTVRRKLMEIFKALDFEKHYTKEDILEWYLNTIYLGEGAYGIKSAAYVYFGKELDELTVKECACLIGITNNPSRYDPYIYPNNNEYRTLTILQQMYEQGYIETEQEYDRICDQVLDFKSLVAGDRKFVCEHCQYEGSIKKFKASGDYYLCPSCHLPNRFEVEEKDYYTYFEDQVIRDVTRDLAEKTGMTYEVASQMVTTGGFRIYSTIDLAAQAKVDEIYGDASNVPETYSSQQMQSAIIVIDNETGDIVAMAGGVGKKEGNLTLNRATQSKLSPGSSIKPLTVYGPGLALGVITPGSAYEDSAYMQLDGKDWPQNENRKYSGWMLVNNGLAQSLNTIAVKVLADVTPEASYQFAKEKLGLESLVESEEINGIGFSDINLAPLGMGQLTHGLTIREMASAYATYPNGGVYRKARTYTRVEDADGNLILDNTQQTNVAMDAHAAWYMMSMLTYAVQYGTGTPARIQDVAVAGKTGTTTSNHDRWFSGFTPKYTATVWCGFDDPEEIRLVVNTNPAVVMWRAVMTSLLEDVPAEEVRKFEQPTDEPFVTVSVCSQTGLLAGEMCEARSIQLFASDVPEDTCNNHAGFDVTICYPHGSGSERYCSCSYCRTYYAVVTSAEFKELAAQYPPLQKYEVNKLEQETLVILKDGKNDNAATLERALEEYDLTTCTIHNAELLREIERTVAEARAALAPETEPEPEPEPMPGPFEP